MTVSMATINEATRPGTLDVDAAEFFRERRTRKTRRLPTRDHVVGVGFALGFAVAAAVVAATIDGPSGRHGGYFVVLAVVYAVLTKAEFEIGIASAIPTQLVFVPMLFVLPIGWVPLCVGAASRGRMVYDMARGQRRAASLPLAFANSLYAVPPVVVLALALGHDAGAPQWSHWPVYGAALASQFAFDFAMVTIWNATLGSPLTSNLRLQLWIYSVDA